MRSFLLCMSWFFEPTFVHSPDKSRVIENSFAPHPPTPCSPEIRIELDPDGNLARPNFWGKGE